MKKIDQEMFRVLSSEAQAAERLHKNLNFYDSYDDPSQRMRVAMKPGSYVRPHQHLAPPKTEHSLC